MILFDQRSRWYFDGIIRFSFILHATNTANGITSNRMMLILYGAYERLSVFSILSLLSWLWIFLKNFFLVVNISKSACFWYYLIVICVQLARDSQIHSKCLHIAFILYLVCLLSSYLFLSLSSPLFFFLVSLDPFPAPNAAITSCSRTLSSAFFTISTPCLPLPLSPA
jgi:hypothetical protein